MSALRPAVMVLAVFLSMLAGCGDDNGEGAASASRVHDTLPPMLEEGASWVILQADRGRDPGPLARALAERGFQVLTRAWPDHEGPAYLVGVKETTRELMARGVEPTRLALVGQGEGGRLTLAVAAIMSSAESPVVVLGACPAQDRPERAAFDETMALDRAILRGRILSLVARGNPATQPCAPDLEGASNAETWETLLEGGPELFSSPAPPWLDEMDRWLKPAK